MAEISLRPRKNLTLSAASTTLLVCLDGLSKLIKSWAEYLFLQALYRFASNHKYRQVKNAALQGAGVCARLKHAPALTLQFF
jgi:hypothetical protein